MKRRAFTLIELLVVISLIALLAVLLIPSFNTVRSVQRDTQCRTNLSRLGEGFILASDPATARGVLSVKQADSAGLFPSGMIWPSIPNNVLEDIELFQCPEDEVKQSSVQGSLANVEYESPHGRYPLDQIGDGNCYKSRRGHNAKGSYTEYIMQDDEGTGGQYAQMSFTGWIDTDGGCRIYDSGQIMIFKDLIPETTGCSPAWTNNHGPGWPSRINTCGNMNSIRYMGEPSLNGNGKMQDARGKTFMLQDWGERMTNYGMNIYAYRYDSGGGCIVLVDYQESMVNIDDRSGSASRLLQSARHFERV
ncbi:MAG: prepilin-type N-terminal cleavage/methylation domain-containing protein, partial [Phycisphaerae bacterium]|nr:prepilin-type N-terminal cleavage/methylation domain-containing protein [Phycisphaerae bacterium]